MVTAGSKQELSGWRKERIGERKRSRPLSEDKAHAQEKDQALEATVEMYQLLAASDAVFCCCRVPQAGRRSA